MGDRPRITIDGRDIGSVQSFTLTNNIGVRRDPPDIALGKFEVSGSMTAYFENPALLAAMFERPHKASVWEMLAPTLWRAALYTVLAIATSFLLIAGAF